MDRLRCMLCGALMDGTNAEVAAHLPVHRGSVALQRLRAQATSA